MKTWPSDLMQQHSLLIEAMCADWLETGVISHTGPKATRIDEINRQVNQRRAKHGNVSGVDE